MSRFEAHSARTLPVMRIASLVTVVSTSTALLCAEVATADERANLPDRGSWRRQIVDGGRHRTLPSQPLGVGGAPAFGVVQASYNTAGRPLDDAADRAAWSLQLGRVRPPHAHRTYFGSNRGIPVAGDFNGDGFAELGMFVDGRWYLDLNGSGAWDDGDLLLALGERGDLPVVGDWNEDGKADIAVYTPAADDEAAVPVVGDWSGRGVDAVGLFRNGLWLLDRNNDGRLTADDEFVQLGEPGDRPVVGDFNRDGRDELGVYRRGQWLLDISGDRRLDRGELTYQLGDDDDTPVVGDWDGDGRDQIGVVHR
jgi:hypothetical protein